MSTLNVGTANATTVNVGTGGIRFSDTTTMTTAPVTDIALNDINNVSAASPSADQVLQWNGSAWVNADASGGIEVGTRSQRPSNPSGAMSNMRYNTTDDYLENYFYNGGEGSQTGWHAVGGRQLIAHRTVQESVSSIDIRWGQAATNTRQKYWGYEIHFSFFENNSNDTYWYLRWWDGQNSLSQGGNYYYNMELWASNDGNFGGNQNGGSEIFLNSWSTYRGTANGESHHSFVMWMHNCPHNSSGHYWSYHWKGGGSQIQEGGGGGNITGGGGWNGGNSSPQNGNVFPIRGFRLYYNPSSRNVSQGINTNISVFGISGFEGEQYNNGYGDYN